MQDVTKNLKREKASEPDGTGNEAWIYGTEKLSNEPTDVSNNMRIMGKTPEESKEETIFPTCEKGDEKKVERIVEA